MLKIDKWEKKGITYGDIWERCLIDIKKMKDPLFFIEEIVDWRPADIMYGISFGIPCALILYLRNSKRYVYIYKTMVFELVEEKQNLEVYQ